MNNENGPVVKISGLSKRYQNVQALTDIDLEIGRGEILGLIGHNGAGKSTLFKLMMGFITPSSGTAQILGVESMSPQFKNTKARIGYLPEQLQLYDNLSGRETLSFFASLKRLNQKEVTEKLEAVGLTKHADRKVKDYSKGLRQRLGFAQALLGDPKLLFLDEPTNGLDPDAIRQFYQTLTLLKTNGTTIILSSHILSEIEQRVDRLAVLRNGKLVADDCIAGLRASINLPLHFTLHIKETNLPDDVHRMLNPYVLHGSKHHHRIELEVTNQDKLAVLEVLVRNKQLFIDFYWKEPRLEDIYMGLGSDKPIYASQSSEKNAA